MRHATAGPHHCSIAIGSIKKKINLWKYVIFISSARSRANIPHPISRICHQESTKPAHPEHLSKIQANT
jgi:hypothetical protein